MKYYVAYDGGGSKIEAILFDENLKLINSAKSGSMNTSSSSPELVRQNALNAAHSLMDGTGITEIESVYGVFTRGLTDALAEVVKVNSLTDAGGESLIGLLSAFVLGDAVTLLSGTGSVVFYLHDNKVDEAGGYGSVIHDEGSGYHMGRLAFAEAIKDYEKRGPHTLISDCICKKLGVDNIGAAAGKIYDIPDKSPISAVASVAVCVGEAARMGDETAVRLLKQVGENLAEQALGLINRCNIPVGVPVVLEGGHFKNDRRISEAVIERIHRDQPDRKIVIPYFEPIVGAVLAKPYFEGSFPDRAKLEEMKKEYEKYRFIMK